jgi:hypothetical protein
MQEREVQRPMDDSQADYPSAPTSVELSRKFANRPLAQIMSGDPSVAKGLSGPQALEALENGTYRGLEGIDFGTSYGRPVAKLPNGTVVEVTAGQVISAVKTRESKRRELLATILRNADKDAYVAKNQQAFDSLLQGLIDDGGLSPAAAGVYQQSFETDPKATLGTLIGIDRNDRRAMKEAERAAQKQADANHVASIQRRLASVEAQTKGEMAAGATPKEIARRRAVNQGLVALGDAAMDGGVNWESTVPAAEIGEFYGSQVLAANPRLGDIFGALSQAKAGAQARGEEYMLAGAPGFSEIVKGLQQNAGPVVGMTEGYATEVALSMFGESSGYAIESARNAAKATSDRSRQTMFSNLVFGTQAPYNPSNAKDTNDDGSISSAEKLPVAEGFAREALKAIGIDTGGMTQMEVFRYINDNLRQGGRNQDALLAINNILRTQFEMGLSEGEAAAVGGSSLSQGMLDQIAGHGRVSVEGYQIPGTGETVRRGSGTAPGPQQPKEAPFVPGQSIGPVGEGQ